MIASNLNLSTRVHGSSPSAFGTGRLRTRVCLIKPAAAASNSRCAAGRAPEARNETHETRRLLIAGSLFILPQVQAAVSNAVAAEQEVSEFRLYEDSKNGFSLSVPSSFELTEKAGATALFVDPEKKSTQVGVTVNPVRVRDLSSFGTLDDVGDKLIGAEKAKESTLECNLIYQRERYSASGTLFFDYSYELDSTRGRKYVQTSVTIKNSKLYIMNASVKCSKESCEDFGSTIALLGDAMNSFDV